MSNSVQPHRRQPTRLPRPWDSPGKNTGVGYHFLLQCMKVKSESEVAQSCLTLRPHGLQPTRLLHPWDFPGKSTGVGCHCLLRSQLFRGVLQNTEQKELKNKAKYLVIESNDDFIFLKKICFWCFFLYIYFVFRAILGSHLN